ncbi:MAG: hypothetical protein GC192_06515 [Bacteroidetes bacterium]|nr:hypothetical protein [Bacteroidota bacterium]
MKTQFIKTVLVLFICSGLGYSIFQSCSKYQVENDAVNPKIKAIPPVSSLDVECDTPLTVNCSNPCQSGCSTFNDLFGTGSTPGDNGSLDDIINCRLGDVAVEPCDIPCGSEVKIRSGVSTIGWLYESPCTSPFNNAVPSICNGGITATEQEDLIDAAETLANNNIPAGCDYVIAKYDFFWVRVTGECPITYYVKFFIGVEITYVPTICAG